MGIFSRLKNRTKLVRKRFGHRARIQWNYLFAKRIQDPVFVLATHRSGGNLLLDCLNSIPDAAFANEILHPTMYYGLRRRWISKRAVMRHIAHSVHGRPARLRGAKLILDRLSGHGVRVADIVRRFPSARFILLYRRSLLGQFVSLKIAERSGVWLLHDGMSAVSEPITVAPGEFEAYCRGMRGLYAQTFAQLRGTHYAEVAYEDLANNPQRLFDRKLFAFLGIDPVKIAVSLVRQTVKMPEEIVRNYDEVRMFVENPAA